MRYVDCSLHWIIRVVEAEVFLFTAMSIAALEDHLFYQIGTGDSFLECKAVTA
jgi:hypothetical protein